MPDWISVKDRLPDDRTECLIYSYSNIIVALYHSSGKFFEDSADYGYIRDLNEVTHWMELPEPPKEEKEEPTNVTK